LLGWIIKYIIPSPDMKPCGQ